MREFLLFIAYLLLALALAAGLLPLLHAGVSLLGEVRPDRLYYRSAMLFALLGLWPLLRWLDLRGRAAWGYDLPRQAFLRQVWHGWLAGVAILIGLLTLEGLAGIRTPTSGLHMAKLLSVLASGLFGGLLVALIEETFFRGVMHGAMRRRLSFPITAALTAALYASLHFTRPPRLAADAVVDWSTGWQLLAHMGTAYAQPLALADSWLALFAVGMFLSLVRERNGNIALALGLHAGWVMVIKVGQYLTALHPDAPLAQLVGSYDGIIGWLAAAWISLLAWLYTRRSPAPKR
jgi:membrane protease YdiL (CAAX protease family)